MIAVYELYQTDTFRNDLKKVDKRTKESLRHIIEKLLEDPTRYKPLKGKPGYYRIRLGVYRLIYKLEAEKIVLMFVKKRGTVYKKL